MLEAIKICKSFSSSPPVLDHISLTVKTGEFLTLLGPSGCGKTTFLRCLAGLETPDKGELLLKGQAIGDWPAQKRPFHMVFQRYALFPHMTVTENIEFSLKNKNRPLGERRKRAQELLELIKLPDFGSRMPDSLSGGQAQRIALARALADHPELLLLDEPFSALDEKIRVELRGELKSLQKKLGLTFIFVTHDQQEALQMSDRIAVFNKGRIEQLGTPEDLFFKPQTLFVAEFLGQKNKVSQEGSTTFFLNPEKVILSGGEVKLKGTVELSSIAGPYYELRIISNTGQTWTAYTHTNRKAGEYIEFGYNKSDLISVADR